MPLLICREDLPLNPRASLKNYPFPYCWDVYELAEEGTKAGKESKLYNEARRVFWECYWRLKGRYKEKKPFFRVYETNHFPVEVVGGKQLEDYVCRNVIVASMETEIVPEEAKRQKEKVYKEIFG
ncbi:MAG: hypothetical protein ACP5KW_09150 [Thermoproteota archaeon]